MYTASVYFLGKYRPAYWMRPTLQGALDAARRATYDIPGPEGELLREWIQSAGAAMKKGRPRYFSCTREHGCFGFDIEHRAHDPFLDWATERLPHYPRLDYSDCSNLSAAECAALIDDGIDAEADRSRA